MKSFVTNNLLATLALCMGVTSGVAVAQVPTKVGTISLQQAVTNTLEAKAAMERLGREFVEPRNKELTKLQDAAREAQEKAQTASKAPMAQSAKDEYQAEAARADKTFRRAVEDYQMDEEDQNRKLLADFSVKMQTVIVEYARANNFAMIFDAGSRDQSGLVFAADSIDITRAITEAYDKLHPVEAPVETPALTPVKPAAPAPAKPAAPAPAK